MLRSTGNLSRAGCALLVYSGIPLATVVIGGILSSTFLTLTVLLTLYEWVEKTGNHSQAPPEK